MSNYAKNQEIREQAGFQYKERGETPTGDVDGSNKIFYTLNNPIVDSNKDGSVTIADVVVYVGEPLTSVTISAVDAVLGKITLASAPASGTPITDDYDWSNLNEAIIQQYADEAHSIVLAKISATYIIPLSETPDILVLIEKKLAAGLLLDKEYSAGGDGTEDSRGRRWIKWAQDQLKEIVSGSLLLLTSGGSTLAQASSDMSGWPDSTTKDASKEDAGGKTHFRIKKQF